MKILEIIKTVDKNSEQNKCFTEWESFASLFEMWFDYNYDKFEKGLTSYFFAKWLCTDTYVGGRVYYLNDEPVAVSWQPARKSSENIEFLSIDAIKRVKTFMLDCRVDDNDDNTNLLTDMDKDYGDGYGVFYGSQLLRKDCIYNPTSESVTIIETFDVMDQAKKWSKVVIQFNNSKTQDVDISDLTFSFGR